MSPSELFLKIASPAVVLTAAALFVIFTVLMLGFSPLRAVEARFKEALNHDLFFKAGTTPYTPRKLFAMLDAYTTEDYRAHYRMLAIDIAYPLVYAFAFSVTIVYLQNYFRPPDATVSPYPVFVPLLAAIFDYLENLSLYLVLRRYQTKRERAGGLAVLSATMTILKILFWVASLLIIVAGLLKLAFE